MWKLNKPITSKENLENLKLDSINQKNGPEINAALYNNSILFSNNVLVTSIFTRFRFVNFIYIFSNVDIAPKISKF